MPQVTSDGNLKMRFKRILDFAMIPQLAVYLTDHSRTCDELFQKLLGKPKVYRL